MTLDLQSLTASCHSVINQPGHQSAWSARVPLHIEDFRMSRNILFTTAMLLIAANASAADEAGAEVTLNVWPGDVPGEDRLDEQFREQLQELQAKNTPERIFSVSTPTLAYFPPAAQTATGTAVIVCPGGGYNRLSWGHEGTDVARWLRSLGVHAFVLQYRVPRRDPDFKLPPLQDAQRAIRIVRHSADKWGINTAKIGVLGFSAGGNLTVNAGTRYSEITYKPVDQIDSENCRPDFMIPVYAAYLGDSDNDRQLDHGLALTKDTPPTFMVVTQDDKNRGIHAALFFAELTKAGVNAEVHVYNKGGHGYGMRPGPNAVRQWPARCEDWMRASGFLPTAENHDN
jgi:acetyl esterase/lipase